MTRTTHLFLSHDWGVDELNHCRVRLINKKLQELGYDTWFDDKDMTGEVPNAMADGIDNTKCFVAFITKRYHDKVTGEKAGDNCKLEFEYAASKKTKERMVAVVLESEMLDTSQWIRSIGLQLCNKIYVDMTGDLNNQTYLSQQINLLKGELQKMGIQPKGSTNTENIDIQPLTGMPLLSLNCVFSYAKC